VSDSILASSHLDDTMRVYLGGVSDLIAAEGRYHKKYLSAYKYHIGKKQRGMSKDRHSHDFSLF